MIDPSDKGMDSEEMMKKNLESSSSSDGQKKTWADCGTTKTPLWRGGPAGPKSLCNACGIRSRKKRRAVMGVNKGGADEKKGKRGNNSSNNNNNNNNNNGNNRINDCLKQRLLEIGREVLMQRSSVERQRKKLGEEEQAAVLLMALSYGSVYA